MDVGDARVGVAVCDPDGLIATPVTTLPRDAEGGADLQALTSLVTGEEYAGVVEVVVGLPMGLSGREGPAAVKARSYAEQLKHRISPIPVRLLDERLSTVDAHRVLRDSGRRTRSHRTVVDQVAAVVILQTALDLERSTGRPPGIPVGPRGESPGPLDDEGAPA